MKLTKSSVAALLSPTDKPEVFHWDDTLPGFGIRLRNTGARRFVCQYRESSGNTRRVMLGDPSVVALDDARRTAKVLLAKVRLGADPQSDKVAARNATMFGELAENYLSDVAVHCDREHWMLFGDTFGFMPTRSITSPLA